MVVLPIVVSVGLPLGFLFIVRRLNLYATSFVPVAVCFAAGLAAFPVAYVVNTTMVRGLIGAGMVATAAVLLLRTLLAPIIEETCKATGLLVAVRRPDFTYFVDGAVCGFAAGTAFAVLENISYLANTGFSSGLGLSVNRALSTSLMHGTASAIVGVALGRLRFGRGPARVAALVVGLGAAMLLHISFNRVVNGSVPPAWVVPAAIFIGAFGLSSVAGLIVWGLREERRWLAETLQLEIGVTAAESVAVQRLAERKAILAPIEARFGVEKRRQVEAFLRLEARLGLQTKVLSRSSDAKKRAALATDIAQIHTELDSLRRAVGVYCMSYLRSTLPAQGEPMWDVIERALAEEHEPTINLWDKIGQRLDASDQGAAPVDATNQGA
jgi:RsiW-degrading membrane proteinase PrsW (M82 family)